VLAAIMIAVVVGWQLANRPPSPWITPGSLSDLQAAGVWYLNDEQIFVLADGDSAIALSAAAPHIEGERVLFCRSSGWFQGQHGEKFDRRGYYMLGPAASGLTRIALRITDGKVEINPSDVLGAIPRDNHQLKMVPSIGPFCGADGSLEEIEPGFAAP
jgi:nitrite reductase/ring-hydroxylating ferredoxin subunit